MVTTTPHVRQLPWHLLLGMLLFVLLCGSSSKLMAQRNIGNAIEQRVKAKGRQQVRNQVSRLKGSGRSQYYSSKRALRTSLRNGGRDVNTEGEPTLNELIEDEEVKNDLANNNNEKRYIQLFGEWLTMPSDLEMERLAAAQARLDSLRRLGKDWERVTKRIWDDSRPMIIFGWHPHWMGELYKGYDYGLYNVVSYYSYDINPATGGTLNPSIMANFMQSEFVSTAHQQGCSALLSVTCHGEDNMRRLLVNNPQAQRRLLDSLVFILDSTNADGIEINFEGVNMELQDAFFRFVQVLSTTVTATRGDTSFVFMSVPPYDPKNVYDISRLEQFVDIFIVKGFDFQKTPEGLEKMPSSPYNYSALSNMPDLRMAVDKYVANIGPLYSGRIVLSLPYSGTLWFTDGVTEEVLDMRSITYSDIQFDFVMQMDNYDRYPGARLRYDSMQGAFTFSYYDYYGVDTLLGDIPVDVTLYFDDTTTLAQKYEYIFDSRLGGVGVQFLGNDMGFYNLETLLSNTFMEMVEVKDPRLQMVAEKSNWFRRNSIYILTVIFYISIFVAIGFCFALFNVRIRQKLFDQGRFRVLFMLFLTLLILLLGGYLGLFKGTTLPLTVGVVFGAIMSWIAWKLLSRRKSLTP